MTAPKMTFYGVNLLQTLFSFQKWIPHHKNSYKSCIIRGYQTKTDKSDFLSFAGGRDLWRLQNGLLWRQFHSNSFFMFIDGFTIIENGTYHVSWYIPGYWTKKYKTRLSFLCGRSRPLTTPKMTFYNDNSTQTHFLCS